MARGIEYDEFQACLEQDTEEEEDDMEGWVDEHEELSDLECEELKANIQPVKMVLVKVRQ